MTKIGTFDAAEFWKNAYAHQRGKLLKKVKVPEDQILILVTKNILTYLHPLDMILKLAEYKKKIFYDYSKFILTRE